MININGNLSFGSLYNNIYMPKGELTSANIQRDTFERSEPKKDLALPKKVTPYTQDILRMNNSIDKTVQYVETIRERAEKRASYVKKLYHAMQHGVCYKNVIRIDKKINGSEYSTLVIEDQTGDIGKIAHIKNGEVQVVYDVLTTLRPYDESSNYPQKSIRANCYTYTDGKCVEYAANILNPVKDYMADSEYAFEFPLWPCRNQDKSPVDKIIGFKENGGYQYYEDYIIDMPGGFKTSVSSNIKEDGSHIITCNENKGLVYTINNDSKGRRPTEHMLIVKTPLPSVNLW